MSGKEFEQFLKRRKEASDDFVNGKFGSLEKISTQNSPATIFGPKGDCVQGPDEVNSANAKGAEQFKPEGTNTFDVIHKDADGDLAYWVGIQRSVVHIRGHDSPIPMDLRVTEIFRRESGEWKLMHRHADQLAAS